jgi:DNA-binding response OmpR family regulator
MKRVLIVDDDPDILTSLDMLLRDTYEVALATHGEAALDAVLEQSFDAMVLDLMMPVLDGAGLLRELRARGLHVPVLLASASHDLAIQARALATEDFIEKPFDPDLLETKLARLIKRGRPSGSSGTGSGSDVAQSTSAEPQGAKTGAYLKA